MLTQTHRRKQFGQQKKGRQGAESQNFRPKKAREAGGLPRRSFPEHINTYPAVNGRHVKVSRGCKHGVHHDLAIPTRVISIENLRRRVSQEPRRGMGGGNNILCGYKYNHPTIPVCALNPKSC